MTPTLALCISLAYVGVLLAVSRWSSHRAGSEEDVFFVAKKAPLGPSWRLAWSAPRSRG